MFNQVNSAKLVGGVEEGRKGKEEGRRERRSQEREKGKERRKGSDIFGGFACLKMYCKKRHHELPEITLLLRTGCFTEECFKQV